MDAPLRPGFQSLEDGLANRGDNLILSGDCLLDFLLRARERGGQGIAGLPVGEVERFGDLLAERFAVLVRTNRKGRCPGLAPSCGCCAAAWVCFAIVSYSSSPAARKFDRLANSTSLQRTKPLVPQPFGTLGREHARVVRGWALRQTPSCGQQLRYATSLVDGPNTAHGIQDFSRRSE